MDGLDKAERICYHHATMSYAFRGFGALLITSFMFHMNVDARVRGRTGAGKGNRVGIPDRIPARGSIPLL